MGTSLNHYSMALDEGDHGVFVGTGLPSRLLAIDTGSGKIVQTLSAVGDCDGVFYDESRKRIYASGGEGAISGFEQQDADRYKEVGRISSRKGARTSFFSPDLGRISVAGRRQGSSRATIQLC